MKKIRAFILQVLFTLLFPILVLAQSVVRNDSSSSDVGSGNGYSSAIGVDAKGRVPIIPGGTPIPFTPSLSEATPAPMVVFQATAVPTTVPTPQFVNTAAMKHSFVTNTTNQDVYVHLNGSVTPAAIVPPGSTWFRNWGSTGSKMSGSIAVTRPGTLPTSGSIAIGGDS